MSYSASDSLLEDHDKYPFFFATTTKPSSINMARLKLLSDFNWRRVAVVATDAYDLQNSKVKNSQQSHKGHSMLRTHFKFMILVLVFI